MDCEPVIFKPINMESVLYDFLPSVKSRYTSRVAKNEEEKSQVEKEKQAGWILPAVLHRFLKIQSNTIKKFIETYPEQTIVEKSLKESKENYRKLEEIREKDLIDWNETLLLKVLKKHRRFKTTCTGDLQYRISEDIDFDAADNEFCTKILQQKGLLMPPEAKQYPIFVYKDELFAEKLDLMGTKENHQQLINMKSLEKTKNLIQALSKLDVPKLKITYFELVTLISWIENNYMEFDSSLPVNYVMGLVDKRGKAQSSQGNPLKEIEGIAKMDQVKNLPINMLRQALMETEVILLKKDRRDLEKRFLKPLNPIVETVLKTFKKEVLVCLQLELAALLSRYLLIDKDVDDTLLDVELGMIANTLHDFFVKEYAEELTRIFENPDLSSELKSYSAMTSFILVSEMVSK